MSVKKKNRRKLKFQDRNFLWYVAEHPDGANMILHVLSDDKQFIVMYSLEQPVGEEYIVILGPDFEGAQTGGCWERFICPRFDTDNVVTPKDVRKLIEWCQNPDIKRETYHFVGYPLL